MRLANTLLKKIGLTLSIAMMSNTVHSAAFGIAEQSALGLGNAFAGGAASAEDASTIWYNPAGMTRIKGHQVVAGLHIITPSFAFSDEGSRTGLGAAIQADGTEDGGRAAFVPNFYYIHSINEGFKLGLGINSPLGMATKYSDQWVGKYQAVESEIITVNINPSIAWKATNNMSLGLGINIQYIEATLNNAVDFTTICYSLTATTCGALPGSNTNDGFAHIEGDDISFGFNVGLLYQSSEKTRLGLSYRSEIRHELEGRVDFNTPSSVTAAIPSLGVVFSDSHLSSQPDLPASASISIYHQWNQRLALMADMSWVGWSSVPNLTIKFDNPYKINSIETLELNDNLRLSLGASYSNGGSWTFRTGLAFDEGAAKDSVSRSPRFPDNDRYWLSFGASYQVSKKIFIDTGYTHIFVPDTKLKRTGSTGEVIDGTYKSDADIFSAQVRWNI